MTIDRNTAVLLILKATDLFTKQELKNMEDYALENAYILYVHSKKNIKVS